MANYVRRSIIIVLCVYIAGLVIWWVKLPGDKVLITIPQGASAKQIASILHKNKIISSQGTFLNLLKLTNRTKKLRAGSYELSARYSLFKVLDVLTKGRAKYIRVTIPEGFTVKQIAERLAQKGIVNRDEFLGLAEKQNLEGYLFPETYFFELNMPSQRIIDRMVSEFNRNFTPQMRKRAGEFKKLNEKKAIILASIIEKEAVVPEERSIISAVFHNRLKKRMYLESCATILYALGKHKEKLKYSDLDIESPYNTYRRFGLPPGPICNPGLAAIKAALYPAKSDALFFVVKGSGTHTFSTYYNDHLREKRKRKRRLKRK